MYTLISSLPIQKLLLEQAPVFLISFLMAEMFYKFHSFTLECLAFLATWYVLDAIANFVSNAWRNTNRSA